MGTRPVWRGAKNVARTQIRSPDRPAGSESLYRLRYFGYNNNNNNNINDMPFEDSVLLRCRRVSVEVVHDVSEEHSVFIF